jgi:hypothetical protein
MDTKGIEVSSYSSLIGCEEMLMIRLFVEIIADWW